MQRWSRRLANSAKRSSKTFLRCVDRVRAEAIEYGKAKRADVVVCGHTHFAEEPDPSSLMSPAYYNTGCWTDHHCHYVTVQGGCFLLAEASVNAFMPAEAIA